MEKTKYNYKEVVVGIETTGHYYEDMVRNAIYMGIMLEP